MEQSKIEREPANGIFFANEFTRETDISNRFEFNIAKAYGTRAEEYFFFFYANIDIHRQHKGKPGEGGS